jgi:hypothetical protein
MADADNVNPSRPAQAERPNAAEGGAALGGEQAAKAAGKVDDRPPILTVWSRSEPKYRVRAIVLLLVNLLLYCGLCVFTHWLHVARPFDFGWESYAAPMKFWGEQTQNLNDFVLYPINVEQTPMHGVVLGLLVASIVAVPISVAILYGFAFALPFVAAVFVFAHMPWMAVTLVGSGILASVRPFRLSFRFGAALVGMLPVILYLYLATRGTPQQIGTYASPDQRLLLLAPWILAILAACAMVGTILLIARIVNYRPGAVAPVMAVMFATPAILFHLYVGFDEVSYRVLEAEYGPRSNRFGAREVTDKIFELLDADMDEPLRQQLLGVWFGQSEHLLALHQRLARRLVKEHLAERRAAYQACRRFIADHPQSRYIPHVLFMQASVLDSRLDIRRTLPPTNPLRRELYSDYPHAQSEEAWRPLLNRYPESPFAIAARLRLAQLHLRRGEVDEAADLLAGLPRTSDARAPAQLSTRPVAPQWQSWSERERSLGFDPEPYLSEAHRLRELIAANRDDPKYGRTPLQELARLDPHRPTYRRQLLNLAQRYRDCLLYDNLVVAWAVAQPDRAERAAKLALCIYNFPDGDAVAAAMFQLGELEIQARGENAEQRRQEGIARLREVTQRFQGTYWAQAAAARLRAIEPAGEGAAAP